MKLCDLSISLEHPQRTYRPGETICGQVRVATQRDEVICERLAVALSYDVQSKFSISKPPKCSERVTLFQGTFAPKATKQYAFALIVPQAPAAYRGKLFQATNVVKAEVEIGFAPILTAMKPYKLAPSPVHTVGPIERRPPRPSWWVFLLLGGLPLSLGIALLPVLSGTDEWYAPWILMSWAAVSLFKMSRLWFLGKQIDHAVLRIENPSVFQGEHFGVCIEVRPRYDLFVNWVAVRLVGREVLIVRASEGSTSAKVHEFSNIEIKNRQVGWLRAKQLYSWRFEVAVPPNVPASTAPIKTQPVGVVEWELQSELDAEGCPDWNERVVVTVNPRASVGMCT